MAPPRAVSHGVYVSNIPYEMTEEQLTHVMSEVGPVQQTRLAFHADTGRAKGFGFVDYYSETAASAVRNLSGRPLPPPFNRALTITFQQDDAHSSALSSASDDPRVLLTHPPRGREMDRGVKSTDAITQTLASVPGGQLEEVLGRMKGLIASSPQEAHQILTAHPQLAYALFQAMLMMNLVDPAVISRMTNSSSAGAPPPTSSTPQHPSSAAAAPAGARYAPSHAPPSGPAVPPPPAPAPAPAPSGAAAGAAAPVNPALAALPPDQQAMLRQVLAMSQGQIDVLPEEQRRSVMLLRSQFGA